MLGLVANINMKNSSTLPLIVFHFFAFFLISQQPNSFFVTSAMFSSHWARCNHSQIGMPATDFDVWVDHGSLMSSFLSLGELMNPTKTFDIADVAIAATMTPFL